MGFCKAWQSDEAAKTWFSPLHGKKTMSDDIMICHYIIFIKSQRYFLQGPSTRTNILDFTHPFPAKNKWLQLCWVIFFLQGSSTLTSTFHSPLPPPLPFISRNASFSTVRGREVKVRGENRFAAQENNNNNKRVKGIAAEAVSQLRGRRRLKWW